MNIWLTYGIIAVILVAAELVYFRIADRCNIIDKPNERSSHSTIVLRGGGIIFAISIIVWLILQMVSGGASADFCHDSAVLEQAQTALAAPKVQGYLPFVVGLVMICAVSFWDDVKSLPDSVRLVVQFVATAVMMFSLGFQDSGFMSLAWYWQAAIGIVALVVIVGATDVYNFMDGINGITAGYSLAVLIPLLAVNGAGFLDEPSGIAERMVQGEIAGQARNEALRQAIRQAQGPVQGAMEFVEPSMLVVVLIGVLVFSWFNFRPKGKAKCFAGDVGSVGIAFILLFAIGRLIVRTGDVTWLIFLVVYGVDGVLTIIHRFMLHEHIGQAHRKHAYQIMANELKIGHVKISLLYMGLQLVISLGFIYLCPATVLAHWVYLIAVIVVLAVGYVVFMKKYYHLHEEYLKSLEFLLGQANKFERRD